MAMGCIMQTAYSDWDQNDRFNMGERPTGRVKPMIEENEITGYDIDENYETIVVAHKEDDVIIVDGLFQQAVSDEV